MSREAILCVDDDEQVRGLISTVLRGAGHECVAVGSAEEARRILHERPFAVVLCDIGLPGRSGLDLVDELGLTHPDVATVMVTGSDDPEIAETALRLGAYGYLTKPFEINQLLIDVTNALRRRTHESAQRTYESSLEETVESRTAQLEIAVGRLEESEHELRRAYGETVSRLSRAIESHDSATGAHVERVGCLAQQIALALDIDSDRAEIIRLVTPLHDIGKIAVSEAVLRKTGPLDPLERVEMQRHTEVGHDLLAGSGNELLDTAAVIAWTHHERWDGTGYPRGLGGEEIPLEGRIVAVADVFDALTSDRPYRPTLSSDEALAHLAAGSGTHFDPQVVEAFLADIRPARCEGSNEPITPRRRTKGLVPRRKAERARAELEVTEERGDHEGREDVTAEHPEPVHELTSSHP